MSSRTVSVPKYRHHKSSGQAIVQINGRRHYLGKWNTQASKERYAAFIAELAVRPAALPPAATQADAQITVTELAAVYWDFAQGYYVKNGKPTSQLHIVRQSLRPLRDLYGHTPAADFGPLAMQAVKMQLIKRGLARKTINHFCGTIKRLFKWGVSQQLVPVAVYQTLLTVPGVAKGRTKAQETLPILPVEDEVVDATLPHLPVVVGDMVRFQRLTGCRPGEVCQLRPVDVDRSGEIWQYRPESHKTQHHDIERIIYIGPQAQQVLLPYFLRDAQVPCFQPVESEQKRHDALRTRRKTLVQPSRQHRRKPRPARQLKTSYNKDSYNRAIQRACEVAFEMPKELRNVSKKLSEDERKRLLKVAAEWRAANCWSPNQLRHSKATEIRREFGLEAAQVVLGHAKADVTQIYAERDSKLGAEVARRIG